MQARRSGVFEREGLLEPDEIEFGATCIRLLWNDPKAALIVSIDDPPYWEREPAAQPAFDGDDPGINGSEPCLDGD